MAISPARRAANAFARTSGVAFPVIGAPLGMADDDGAGAGILEHFGRKVAGERAGRLGVAVLGPDRHPRSARPGGEIGQQGRGRADQDVDLRRQARARAAMIRSSSAAAALSPFIFQFPAISGRRRPFMPPSPGFFGLGQPGTRAGEATPAPYFHGLYANVARGRTCCGYVLRSL